MLRLGSDRIRELWESTPANGFPEDEPRTIARFGRYVDLEFLGKGGMGRVYCAFDPDLNRAIALKFIHGNDPDLRRRLLNEARLQASLEHENVCKVYEIGEVDGRMYIAMQYLRGITLNAAAGQMNLPQKIRLMIRVAEAVHEAHRAGLIHRDLKPVNIMVEQNDRGEWIPYVMDFGLARAPQSAGMTASGAVLGSPHYMSPEQARGEILALDQRSDVYSLGVTLYELLSGTRPFEDESSVQILIRVLHHDPPPLRARAAGIPADLETIVMKCLEKNTGRRYDSARALAADLQRYLDGDPILARPAGLLYRMRKKAAKNRTLSAVILGSAVLILLAAGMAVRASWQARRQAQLAHRFGIEVKEIEGMLRNAHTMPLHDMSRERTLVLKRMSRIEHEVGEVGAAGYGPCHYALGRGYLALQDFDRARTHLQMAWDSGYHETAVAYALGQVLGILYDRELERIKYLGSQRESRLPEIQREYRAPALEYLKSTRDSAYDPPSYVEGLISFYDGKLDQALIEATRALQEVPWLYEARKLEGDIHAMRGTDAREMGRYDQAAAEFAASGSAYMAAINMARSDSSLYVSDCARWVLTMEVEMARGTSSDQPLRDAVIACDNALKVQPDNAEALEKKAWAYWRWGEFRNMNGEDPQSTLLEAIRYGREAVQANPQSLDAWTRLGASYNTLGEYRMERGMDPRDMLNAAIDSSHAMMRIDPNHPYAANILGYAALTIGEYELANGLDPRAALNQAIEGFRKTTKYDPRFAKGFNNLAYAYMTLGLYEMEHGIDPRASLDLAIRGFQDAIRVNSRYAGAYSNMAMARIRRARYETEKQADPMPFLEQAEQDCRHSLELNPQSAFGYNALGLAHLEAAKYRQGRHQDPSAEIQRSITALMEALHHKPDSENALSNLITAILQQASFEIENRRTPSPRLQDAHNKLQKLQTINPDAVPALLARTLLLEAQWEAQNGRPPMRLLAQAAGTLQKPDDAATFELLASIYAQRARWEKEHNLDPADSVRQGMEAADAALRIHPAHPEATELRRSMEQLLPARPERGLS